MKRALAIISICMIASPVMATSTTTTKKHHHCKRKHSCHHTHTYKDQLSTSNAPMKDTAPAKPAPSFVDEVLSNVSGSYTLTSNYVFRGISQTEDKPAVQGGITYTFPVGLYANVWGSNVQFNDGKGANIELDEIAGWRGTVIHDLISYDVNFDRYNYPGAVSSSYNEVNGLFVYNIFQLGLGYSSNVYATHKTGIYTNGTINYPIPSQYVLNFENLSGMVEYGHYSLPRAAGNSYNDWSLGLTKKLSNTYSVTAQYTDTNGRQNNPPYDGSQLFAMLNATF